MQFNYSASLGKFNNHDHLRIFVESIAMQKVESSSLFTRSIFQDGKLKQNQPFTKTYQPTNIHFFKESPLRWNIYGIRPIETTRTSLRPDPYFAQKDCDFSQPLERLFQRYERTAWLSSYPYDQRFSGPPKGLLHF